ncbi:hypothetical protein MSPP1_003278 [Malassezia sp. CBS 17886]|nr:hypothetical protein MSPP1_003278 [Malassezia sp. CBS 17886]
MPSFWSVNRSRAPSAASETGPPDTALPNNQPRRSVPNILAPRGSFSVPASPARGVSPGARSPRASSEGPAASFEPAQGHEGNVSSTQQQALDKLTASLLADGAIEKENAPSYQQTQLLRFLRARNFDADAARTMYMKAQEWKRDMELDRLCAEFDFEEREDVAAGGWRMYFHKTDRLGRPIFIQDLSNLDSDRIFARTSPDRIVANFAVTLEKAVQKRYQACTDMQGHLVDDNYMVLNVSGLGLSSFWTMRNQLQHLLAILDENFPELSGYVLIINAPYLFSTVWACIKSWLPLQTAEKIQICGGDYMACIGAHVDLDNWPEHLGGRCQCGAPTANGTAGASPLRACERSDAGPWNSPASTKLSPA